MTSTDSVTRLFPIEVEPIRRIGSLTIGPVRRMRQWDARHDLPETFAETFAETSPPACAMRLPGLTEPSSGAARDMHRRMTAR
ncbi:UNVERIFIED_ORG: hypothetical protein FHR35_000565 [Microbispora rosea subsp. rosea]